VKTYKVFYSLTFYNSVDVEAMCKAEAIAKFAALDESVNLPTFMCPKIEDGYKILSAEEVKEPRNGR
jgi:hypothetical protein